MNGVVHHDRLKRVGSTFLADTQPDFITCDDPWFRPVDLCVGPDGALYMADFYNAIIGHYEAPLTHPKRDRSRGRIWRVVYTGTGGRDAETPPNLVKMKLSDLVPLLGHANLAVRVLATNQLVDRGRQPNGKLSASATEIAAAVRAALERDGAPETLRAHALWTLERLDALDDALLHKFAQDVSPLARTHLMRILAERRNGNAAELTLIRQALHDDEPMVRRVAADALGRRPMQTTWGRCLTCWQRRPRRTRI